MSEEQAPDLPPWNEVVAGNKLKRHTAKPGKMDIPGLMVIKPVNDHLAAAVDYRNYCLLKKLATYDDDVAHELHKIEKKIAAQMKDRTFFGEYPISAIVFGQESKWVCDA